MNWWQKRRTVRRLTHTYIYLGPDLYDALMRSTPEDWERICATVREAGMTVEQVAAGCRALIAAWEGERA